MDQALKKNLIESLKNQQEIFGNDLFDAIHLNKSTRVLDRLKVSEKIEINQESKLFMDDFQNAESIEQLYSLINECKKCPLGETRKKFVFGVGNPKAHAMLIGEAPGADEDAQGEPFVGRAGKLLNDILKAVNLKREEVYIANILKCRPPGNRDPQPFEMETCIHYLHKQIDLIKPNIILCLGRVAANGLLNKKLSLGDLRNNVYEFNGIKVMATYHPAALLRNPHWKRGCWEDVQKFKKLYDELLTE